MIDPIVQAISDFGKAAEFLVTTTGVYDKATGKVGSSTVSVNITVLEQGYVSSDLPNSLVEQGDRKIIFTNKGLSSRPTTQDKITIGTTTLSIIDVNPISKQSDVLVYVCQTRAM
tara:strand:+ start:679 stop:1023 length:345 start_codon:yes stop_codon:yes gene_type:complete